MATNVNEVLAAFGVAVDKRRAAFSKKVRKSAFSVFDDIQMTSPKDTGLFQSSHDLTISQISTMQSADNMEAQKSKARARLDSAQIKDGMKIFITNNLVYAQALEHGHSQQAPNGVYALAAERAKRKWNNGNSDD